MTSSRWIGLILAVAGAAGIGIWTYKTPSCERCPWSVRLLRSGGCWKCGGQADPHPVGLLSERVVAQVDYRSKRSEAAFWRKDVAGLWGATGQDVQPVKCVRMLIAAADDRPATAMPEQLPRAPMSGYWIRTLMHEGELTPSPDRFAFCAFPDGYAPGRKTYIVDERNAVYVRDLGRPGGVDRFPTEDELNRLWKKKE